MRSGEVDTAAQKLVNQVRSSLHVTVNPRYGVLKNGTVTEEDKKAYIEAWSQPGALTGGLNYYRAAAAGPPRPGETASPLTAQPLMVRVPTLVIWGEKDTALLTGNLNGLDQYVTKLTVRRIPDATHWVVREKSAEVNRAIREFLSQ